MFLGVLPVGGAVQPPILTFLQQITPTTTNQSFSVTVPHPGLLVVTQDLNSGGGAPTWNGTAMTLVAGGATTTPQIYQIAVTGSGTLLVPNCNSLGVYLIQNLLSNTATGSASDAWGNASTATGGPFTVTVSSGGFAICCNKTHGANLTSWSSVSQDYNDTTNEFASGHLSASASVSLVATAGPVGGAVFLWAAWR